MNFVRRGMWCFAVFQLARLAAPGVQAQDVTVLVAPLIGVDQPMTEPPTWVPLEKGPRIDYPKEMAGTAEIGYVLVREQWSADGKKAQLDDAATHEPFSKVYREAVTSRRVIPIGAGLSERWRYQVVIFNPKSSAAVGPDVRPRLLQVAPIISTQEEMRKVPITPVRIKVLVGVDGRATLLEAPSQVSDDVRRSLPNWLFAPARSHGVAEERELELMVVWQPPKEVTDGRKVLPVLLTSVAPKFPPGMVRLGESGLVLLECTVGIDGKGRDPKVIESNHPGFDLEAVRSLAQWTFSPGMIGGKPQEMKMQVKVVFHGRSSSRQGVFSWKAPKDPSVLPEEYRYDVPPTIVNAAYPVYPVEAMMAGVNGKAKLAYVVNQYGDVSEAKVLEADDPRFGEALLAAVSTFKFKPALREGRPTAFLATYEQTFSAQALDVQGDLRVLEWQKKQPERIVGAGSLDRAPRPISRRAPVFPRVLRGTMASGVATIEFFIDQDGRVCAPRVVEASAPEFGYAAVQAISTWLFEPPVAKGKPTVVRVQVPVEFSLKS